MPRHCKRHKLWPRYIPHMSLSHKTCNTILTHQHRRKIGDNFAFKNHIAVTTAGNGAYSALQDHVAIRATLFTLTSAASHNLTTLSIQSWQWSHCRFKSHSGIRGWTSTAASVAYTTLRRFSYQNFFFCYIFISHWYGWATMGASFAFACTSLLEPWTRENVAPGRAIVFKRTNVVCTLPSVDLGSFKLIRNRRP
jgi:hypothetical protein